MFCLAEFDNKDFLSKVLETKKIIYMSKTLKASANNLVKNTTDVRCEGKKFITKTTIRGKDIAVETTVKLEDLDNEVLVLELVPGVSYDGRTFYKVFP
jgi:hypothetical protein